MLFGWKNRNRGVQFLFLCQLDGDNSLNVSGTGGERLCRCEGHARTCSGS